VFITAFTFIKLPSIKNPKPSLVANGQTALVRDGELLAATDKLSVKGPSLHLTVNGQQYVWRYHYPGKENLLAYGDMVVPVGQTVILDITADDVAHSWWIPKLGGKMDAIPGYTNHTWFKIPGKFGTKPGGTVFFGQCAELCGRNHANMTARVRAVSVQEYQRWIDQRKADIKSAEDQAAQQRRRLEGSTANSQPAGPAAAGQNPARPGDASDTMNPQP
jgi:cytochrome c oxidase subunit II